MTKLHIFACRECSGRIRRQSYAENTDDVNLPLNPLLDAQKWLKEKLKKDGLWHHVNFITGNCMNVCPPGKITFYFRGESIPDDERYVLAHPQHGREMLYAKIVHALTSKKEG